jgi:hypothetical protein
MNTHLILYIIASLLLSTSWLIMLAKHKYKNILRLIAIGLATVFCITNVFENSSSLDLGIAGIIYSLSIFVEEYRFLRLSWFFTHHKDTMIIKYDDLVDEDEPTLQNIVKNKQTYKNGTSIAYIGEFISDKTSEKYMTDYDILYTVYEGSFTLMLPDKNIVLKKGNSYKAPAFVPKKIQGKIGTKISATLIKV